MRDRLQAPENDPLFPPRSGNLRRGQRLVARAADAVLDARQAALGIGRALDRATAAAPIRRVLVLGIYGSDGAAPMTAAIRELERSRHDLSVALGALGPPPAALDVHTVRSNLSGGKFANLNRVAEAVQPLAADWLVLLDDDVALPRHFLDRLLYLAESLALHMVQPALRRSSHGAWPLTRRQAALARQTRFVEIGPVTVMHRDAYRVLAPFPEQGMGWGVDQHWAAIARREGWRLGIADAVPVRHDLRPIAAGYTHAEALAAAHEFLRDREHLRYREAQEVVARHDRLP